MSERRIKEEITANARSLRKGMTDVERIMWRAIRGEQLYGNRFRRQHPIGPYIVDFACLDKKCVIELDGGQHQNQIAYDERKRRFLQEQGRGVLRFWNNEVVSNLEGVLSVVMDTLTTLPPS